MKHLISWTNTWLNYKKKIMKEANHNNTTADREIVITRVLDAPRELVFKVWTDPKHLINWFGPNGFTNTFHEVDIKPGGVWRFTMHGPNGMNFPNLVKFSKIVIPERLEYEHGSGDENDTNKFNVVVTFEEYELKTRLTMRSIFSSAEARDHVVKEHHAIEGGNQTLDKLELYISTQFNIRKQLKTKNMARVSTYLNFSNYTEKAFNFYKSVFGTEFLGDGITRFGSIPPSEEMPPLSEEDQKLILHVQLPILGGHILMGTDAPESMGFNLNFGNNVHINLEPDSREETKRLFDALSAGGTVTMELQDMFFGSYYGSCTDQYGVNWMVNFTETEK
jgi:uncharacterized protein YndB with AHSA1/START domain/uncharacterized glyoxalase superfamily protein PhnB